MNSLLPRSGMPRSAKRNTGRRRGPDCFRDQEQAQARRRERAQVHLEHQDRGLRRVLGEEPGDERAEAEATHVRRGADQGRPAAG
jgi:hypothetical protein